MPGPRCNITFCNNYSGQLTDEGEKITFHRFPKKPELRNIWLEKCQKQGNWNVNYAYVCSEHFQKDDFKRDLQAELLGYKGRRKLKPFAAPSLNLPSGNKVKSKSVILRDKDGKERHEQLIEECLLSRTEEIPLSYDMSKKWYKKRSRNKEMYGDIYSSSKLVALEISEDRDKNHLESVSAQNYSDKQAKEKRDVRNHLKRNLDMQRKMMEKIFLATYIDEPFSEENFNYVDEDYLDKAKSALLKVFALAPNSYNKYAKQLNLPSKDVLLSWNNRRHLNNE